MEFSQMDQDVRNATVTATDAPLHCSVRSDRDLSLGRRSDALCIVSQNSHRREIYVYDPLREGPPNGTHLAYWQFVDGRIRPSSRLELAKEKEVAIACLIGLFHGWSYRDL